MGTFDGGYRQYILFLVATRLSGVDTQCPVLLVEDDPVDAMLVRRAFKMVGLHNPLHVVSSGEAALSYLATTPMLPTLMLLDLNMPGGGGLELLAALAAHPQWYSIPVVVLTTSSLPDDYERSRTLAAAGYIVKPMSYADFLDVLRALRAYWSDGAVDTQQVNS